MSYAFIDQQRTAFGVRPLCQALGVATSGYYAQSRLEKSPRARHNAGLLDQIKTIHQQSRRTYGAPRITAELQDQGQSVGKNRVARLMRANGIRAKMKRRYRATTNSAHKLPVAPNLVQQQFTVAEPDRLWVSDISYIPTKEGWLYLCVFMDLFSRRIIGWSMGETLEAELVDHAFRMAYTNRHPLPGLIVHSDRGVQYASTLFRERLEACGALQSMSRKGNCYDNAPSESFYHTLKTEEVHFHQYDTRQAARTSVFEYIEAFYNTHRRHSTLGYLSPCDFERLKRAS